MNLPKLRVFKLSDLAFCDSYNIMDLHDCIRPSAHICLEQKLETMPHLTYHPVQDLFPSYSILAWSLYCKVDAVTIYQKTGVGSLTLEAEGSSNPLYELHTWCREAHAMQHMLITMLPDAADISNRALITHLVVDVEDTCEHFMLYDSVTGNMVPMRTNEAEITTAIWRRVLSDLSELEHIKICRCDIVRPLCEALADVDNNNLCCPKLRALVFGMYGCTPETSFAIERACNARAGRDAPLSVLSLKLLSKRLSLQVRERVKRLEAVVRNLTMYEPESEITAEKCVCGI